MMHRMQQVRENIMKKATLVAADNQRLYNVEKCMQMTLRAVHLAVSE